MVVPSSAKNAAAVVTNKDRMRLLLDTNQVAPRPSFQQASHDMFDVAQNRLAWLRLRLLTHWNPDNPEGATPTVAAARRAGPPFPMRPLPQGPVMDARWWLWNVAFALLPAVTIAAFCELRGNRVMRDFHRRQELAQLKLATAGNDEWDETRATALLDARDAAEREPELHERVWQFWNELYTVVCWQLRPYLRLVEDQTETAAKVDRNSSKLPVPEPPPSRRVQPGPVEIPLLKEQGSSVEELLQRIQLLEERLYKVQKEEAENDKSRRIQQQFQRVKQSGVHNRVEDGLLQKWKPYMNQSQEEAMPSQPHHHQGTTSVSETAIENPDASTVPPPNILLNMVKPLWTYLYPHVTPSDEDQSDSVPLKVVTVAEQRTSSALVVPHASPGDRAEGEGRRHETDGTGNTGETSNIQNDASAASLSDELTRPWWKRIRLRNDQSVE